MNLLFDFDSRQGVTNVRFEGLDGSESVASVKDALNHMRIRNPAVTFVDTVRSGACNDVPDVAYKQMLDTIKYLSSIWYYTGEPEEAPPKYEMNALMLLANAIEALSQFNVLYQMPFEGESPTT